MSNSRTVLWRGKYRGGATESGDIGRLRHRNISHVAVPKVGKIDGALHVIIAAGARGARGDTLDLSGTSAVPWVEFPVAATWLGGLDHSFIFSCPAFGILSFLHSPSRNADVAFRRRAFVHHRAYACNLLSIYVSCSGWVV